MGGRAYKRGCVARNRTMPTVCCRQPNLLACRDVFVYFDNDVKVRAPADALSLTDPRKAGLNQLPD